MLNNKYKWTESKCEYKKETQEGGDGEKFPAPLLFTDTHIHLLSSSYGMYFIINFDRAMSMT